MTEDTTTSSGQKVLSAVERLIEDTEDLIARTDLIKDAVGMTADKPDSRKLAASANMIIANYSNRSAATGALAAVPAIIPGPGMVVAAVGGTLLDIGLMLKHEVEMALCLAHLHGYDISDPNERRMVFLLASMNVSEVQKGGNFLADVAVAEMDAVLHYTPRQITKLLTSLMGKVALRSVSRNPFRVLPLVGVVACGVMNKVFTGDVGRRCHTLLIHRRRMEKTAKTNPEGDVVNARVSS